MSINFNSTGNYIVVGDFAALQNIEPITICAWIYPTGWGGGNYGRIIDKGDGNSFFISNAGGALGSQALVYYRTRTGTPTDFRSNDNSIVLNTWQHVAVSSSSSGTVLYINGQPVSSYVASTVGTGTVTSDIGTNLYVGNRSSDLNRFFQGQQSDVRIYNQALDANAIWTIYSSFGHDSILDGLVLRYTFMDKAPGSTGSIFKSLNSNSVGSSNNVTVNVPSVNDGDGLVAFVAPGGTGGAGPIVNTPSGWALLGNVSAPSTFSTPSLYVFGRIASSEPASYNFTWNVNCSTVAVIAAYDKDYINPITPTVGINSGTSSNPTAPSINVTVPSGVIRAMVCDDDETVTYPGGTIGRFTQGQTGTANGMAFAFSDQTVLSAGATGTSIFTLGASEEWGAITIAFNSETSSVRDISINKFDGTSVEASYSEDILSHRRRV